MGANREFKATLFSELFSDPDNLRELYNALSDTNYGKETPIVINTLENVFFNDLKNDVSFTIDDKYVVLLEHQSTINANMPLRCLMYIARVYEKLTEERAIYQERMLEIPTPEFIVLYNGTKPFPPEKILRLSEAYKVKDEIHKSSGNLDFTIRVVNINPGCNDDLLQKSEALNGYTIFVERVRRSRDSGINLRDAITEAINWGMTQSTIKTFLKAHGLEASSMLMTEFNIDIAKEVWQEEAREDGYEEGLADARKEIESIIADKDAKLADKDARLAEKDLEIEKLKSMLREK